MGAKAAPSVTVIAVCAVRTGCGKSAVSRYVIKTLAANGLKSAAIRAVRDAGLDAVRTQWPLR